MGRMIFLMPNQQCQSTEGTTVQRTIMFSPNWLPFRKCQILAWPSMSYWNSLALKMTHSFLDSHRYNDKYTDHDNYHYYCILPFFTANIQDKVC